MFLIDIKYILKKTSKPKSLPNGHKYLSNGKFWFQSYQLNLKFAKLKIL